MSDCGLPIIRDTVPGEFSFDCPVTGGLPVLHLIRRTLPTRVVDSFSEDFYQFEDLSPVGDEITGTGILDNFKDN